MIGLLDLDSDNNTLKTSFPNLALMKLSQYYKEKGREVRWYSPLFDSQFEKIFVSKVFSFKTSPLEAYIKKEDKRFIMGGIAFDRKRTLPYEIEHIYPDYELYDVDYALGFLTRGCIRNCKFCLVREKEGNIHIHANLHEFTKEQEKVMLLDNNILSHPKHISLLKDLLSTQKRFDFNQGLDIRLIDEKNAKLLGKIKRWPKKRMRFAFDDVNHKTLIEKKLFILEKNGINKNNLLFYVLMGFDSSFEEDMERIQFLRKKRLDPYVMAYNQLYQPHIRLLQRWVNFKKIFWKYSWKEFLNTQKNRREYEEFIKMY